MNLNDEEVLKRWTPADIPTNVMHGYLSSDLHAEYVDDGTDMKAAAQMSWGQPQAQQAQQPQATNSWGGMYQQASQPAQQKTQAKT